MSKLTYRIAEDLILYPYIGLMRLTSESPLVNQYSLSNQEVFTGRDRHLHFSHIGMHSDSKHNRTECRGWQVRGMRVVWGWV